MGSAANLDLDFEAHRDPLRIFIVDDHRVVAESIAAILNGQPDMAAIGIATRTEIADGVIGLAPDLVIVDVGSIDKTGTKMAQMRQVFPVATLVVLSDDDSEAAAIAALESGASAFIHISQAVDELIATLRRVARGDIVYNRPHSIGDLLAKRRRMNATIARLTPREKEVLQFLAKGIASRQIAQELGIGYTTVRAHVHGVLQKLSAHSKIEGVCKARRIGLVE